jgi:hypothetical protein
VGPREGRDAAMEVRAEASSDERGSLNREGSRDSTCGWGMGGEERCSLKGGTQPGEFHLQV